MVLGSKNNAYTISLNDTKHTCQCLDYRKRQGAWGGAGRSPNPLTTPLQLQRPLRAVVCCDAAVIQAPSRSRAGFRRHNCKHILLVLSQLGVEECPGEVRGASVHRGVPWRGGGRQWTPTNLPAWKGGCTFDTYARAAGLPAYVRACLLVPGRRRGEPK